MAEIKKGDKISLKRLPKQDYYEETINDIIKVLKGKHSDSMKLKWCSNTMQVLETWFQDDELVATKFAKKRLIPLFENLIDDCEEQYMSDFFDYYKRLYAFCGKRDLECFIDYMEFDKSNRVLANRRDILLPFIDALNRLDTDNNLKYVIASFFPSAGKSFCANYYTAWVFGRSINNSVLRLSYNEELVLGFSRSIKVNLSKKKKNRIGKSKMPMYLLLTYLELEMVVLQVFVLIKLLYLTI